jgi:phospholipase/carboxylesterase
MAEQGGSGNNLRSSGNPTVVTSPFPDFLPSDDGQQLQVGPNPAQRRLVLLHGWGADAGDLLDLGAELAGPEVSVVALRAPHPHPGGFGRQWYGLQPPQFDQLPAARAALRRRLEELGRSVALERTALLGFSQGGAMALDVATGAGGALPLASLIACSAYPHPDWSPAQPRSPILLTHGELDEVVPFAACTALEQALKQAGGTVEHLSFKGGHGIPPDLVPPMRQFLADGWRA